MLLISEFEIPLHYLNAALKCGLLRILSCLCTSQHGWETCLHVYVRTYVYINMLLSEYIIMIHYYNNITYSQVRPYQALVRPQGNATQFMIYTKIKSFPDPA